jgi:hypothetical protein
MNTRYCLQTTHNQTVKMMTAQSFYHVSKPYSIFHPVVCKHWLWASLMTTTAVFQHIRSEDISSCFLSWLDHFCYTTSVLIQNRLNVFNYQHTIKISIYIFHVLINSYLAPRIHTTHVILSMFRSLKVHQGKIFSFWGSNNELKYVSDSSCSKHEANTKKDSELQILVMHQWR